MKTVTGSALLATALSCGLSASAFAQSPGPTAHGSYNGTYGTVPWQYMSRSWGTYSGQVGAGGWNFNSQLQYREPSSPITGPNEVTGPFSNPRTGRSLFHPQDTRLKGRDRP
jgi:hypothetical protein